MSSAPNDARYYYALGYSASHLKEVDTVRQNYKKAIDLDASNEWYQISYGWALFNAEAYDAALQQWLKASAFGKGNHPENNITVALGYYGVGDLEHAAQYYNTQIEIDGRYSTFKGLQEATAHWTWHEKEAIYRLYDVWRYCYPAAMPGGEIIPP